MKISIAQQDYIIGDIDFNVSKIINAIQLAKQQKSDLVVFSEMSLCGYLPDDLLESNEFILKCNTAIQKIVDTTSDIAVVIGAPAINSSKKGKHLYNAAYFIENKSIKHIAYKGLLPNYDVFEEYRYFEPATEFLTVLFKGKKIAITICEDMWQQIDAPIYQFNPIELLMQHLPDLLINISASPFDYNHESYRKKIILDHINRCGVPFIYCNTVGAQSDLIFDGGSLVVDAKAKVVLEMSYFNEDVSTVEWLDHGSFINKGSEKILTSNYKIKSNYNAAYNIEKIHDALILGIKDYFKKMKFNKAIVASSGGIDSAVVLALACKALGAQNVNALLLPSAYSSNHSVDDAVQLSKNLNNHYDIISIAPVYNSALASLQPVFNGLAFSLAEENLQARIRGLLVMALSNKFGSLLLNTSNKSELATGYGTLYGDMAGALSIIGDLYKTQVYALAHYINRDSEIIPHHILVKPPSAELRPEQKDSDSLPEYDVLDDILFQVIENKSGSQMLVQQGYEGDLVQRILSMVNKNEYKRKQFCPILRVSSKSFGKGRRFPIVGRY